jgi:hypothetical protein
VAQGFVSALRAEIQQLETSLAQDVRYRRLTELRRVLDLYKESESDASGTTSAGEAFAGNAFAGNAFATQSTTRTTGRRTSPERAKALSLAKAFIDGQVFPTPTREILEHLVAAGLTIPGNEPLNNLSAMLSNSADFVSHGRSGWTVRTKLEEAPEATLRTVAELVLSDLGDDSRREAYRDIYEGGGIPSDIDARLLAMTKADIQRDLSENEKRDLRAHFKAMLESSISRAEKDTIEGKDDY